MKEKGKGKVDDGGLVTIKSEPRDSDDDDDVLAAHPEWAPKYDMYVEDGDAGFKRFKVYDEVDESVEPGPDIPMSPCLSEGEPDPSQHAFLLLRKGTQTSS